MKKKLSVVISAYNEEKKIEDCLKSVAWADEIILVDNSSSDSTVMLAKKHNAKVFTQENNRMLNVNKNFGFTQAAGDWILNLDADERVSRELSIEIQKAISEEDDATVGYWIPRKNIIFGKWIQNDMWWPDAQLRLFKKGKGRFPQQHVHEYLHADGPTKTLGGSMEHHNYETISQFLYKLDKIYTENEAENWLREKKSFSYIDALKLPAQDFLKTFFYQKGYKDGLHGLVLSMLQAFYTLVVFAKAWEKKGFFEENPKDFLPNLFSQFTKIALETKYWMLTVLVNSTNNPFKKIVFRILRKQIKKQLEKK